MVDIVDELNELISIMFIEKSIYAFGYRSDLNFIIGLLRRSITILLIFAFGKKFIFKHNLSAYIFNLYIIGFGIYATTYLISPDIGVRMSVYFTVLEMFLLANLLFLVKRVDVKFLLFFADTARR